MNKDQKFYVVMKVSPLEAIKAGMGTIALDWSGIGFTHYLPVFTNRADAVKYADGDESLVLEAQHKT